MVEVSEVVVEVPVDAEPEPEPEAQPEPEPEPEPLVELPWTAHTVDGISKKNLLVFMQQHAPIAFLEERKLHGRKRSIMKASKKNTLVAAYKEVLANPSMLLTKAEKKAEERAAEAAAAAAEEEEAALIARLEASGELPPKYVRGRPVLLLLKIEVGPGKRAALVVRQGDDPRWLAKSFCRRHNVPAQRAGEVQRSIEQNLAMLDQKK